MCCARASSQLPTNPHNCISTGWKGQRLPSPGWAVTSSSCPPEAGHVTAMGMVRWVESSSFYTSCWRKAHSLLKPKCAPSHDFFINMAITNSSKCSTVHTRISILSCFPARTRLSFCSSCEGTEPGAMWAHPRWCSVPQASYSWLGTGQKGLSLFLGPFSRAASNKWSSGVILIPAGRSVHPVFIVLICEKILPVNHPLFVCFYLYCCTNTVE